MLPDDATRLRETLTTLQYEKDQMIARQDFPRAAFLRRCERQVGQSLWQAEYEWRQRSGQAHPAVGEQDIAEVVSLWTGIPVARLVDEERSRLLRLEEILHQRVIGQHEAVQALARAMRRSRTQLRDPRRPIGSFIFVGPTGVGKTELAGALALALFENENTLLKFDMSEYMESHHISRLIGAPPGYVGYDQAGLLTEAVRRRPYSVILFDEAEKAHPRVFDLLLQILDDGRLTDARGQVVDFRHTVIILTSNVGTTHYQSGPMAFAVPGNGEDGVARERQLMSSQISTQLRKTFHSELLNRIDETIIFHSLEPVHLREILDLLLSQTRRNLAGRLIELQVSDPARELLLARGHSPEYGARALRRTVQDLLDDLLAEAILQGSIRPGDSVLVDVQDGELHLHPTSPVPHVTPPQGDTQREDEAA
jgi:ATP-dependent Clp protease ATP-binding subunit ClpC